MQRGDQRLLHDLGLFGRIAEYRAPARERLQAEIGAATLRWLLPEAGSRVGDTASTNGSQQVA